LVEDFIKNYFSSVRTNQKFEKPIHPSPLLVVKYRCIKTNKWYQSQGHELDSHRVIAEGEIVAGGSNCPVTEVGWSSHDRIMGLGLIHS